MITTIIILKQGRNIMRPVQYLLLAIALCVSLSTHAVTEATVYKSPTCDCCEKYVDYLRKNGFSAKTVNEFDMDAIRERFSVSHIASCHTTRIGSYVVEGHVPVAAIHKLLMEKPAIVGISVPGMPQNSPGMGEMRKGVLTIYAIPKLGQKPYVFSVE